MSWPSGAGIFTKAIRYYEQVGILAPPPRTASGYRSYDEAAMGRLGFVRAAQAVGLTLGEIRQVVAFRDDGQAPCAHVTDLLRIGPDRLTQPRAVRVSSRKPSRASNARQSSCSAQA